MGGGGRGRRRRVWSGLLGVRVREIVGVKARLGMRVGVGVLVGVGV